MYRLRQQSHHRAQQRRKRIRAVAFTGFATLILGLAGYFLISAFARPALPSLAGQVIDVNASMSGFDVKEIHVKAGEPVTIRLTSLDNQFHTDGGGKHQWAVDELGVSIVALPKGWNSATFTPDKPGVYSFYCDVCCGGRANPTMQGRLIVEV